MIPLHLCTQLAGSAQPSFAHVTDERFALDRSESCLFMRSIWSSTRLITAGKRLSQLKRLFYGVDARDTSVVATSVLISTLLQQGFKEHARELQVRLNRVGQLSECDLIKRSAPRTY